MVSRCTQRFKFLGYHSGR
jgi:hypothetical protein